MIIQCSDVLMFHLII